MLKRICKADGCYVSTDNDNGYCERHQYFYRAYLEKRRQGAFRTAKSSNLYSLAEWKRLSKEVLKEHPRCQFCDIQESREVHHLIPHRGDRELFLDRGNLVALCHDCHTRATWLEIEERKKNKANP